MLYIHLNMLKLIEFDKNLTQFIQIYITCDVMVTKLNIHIDFNSTGMLYELEMYKRI